MSKDVNNIGNRSSTMKNLQDVDIEYRKKKIAFVVQVAKLNKFRVSTPEEMTERLEELFQLCVETGNIPNYEALAVACGIPIRTFYDMSTGNFDKTADFSPIIKSAKDTIALMESSMANEGKIPSAVWIFRAKNYMGMKDVQQIEAVQTASGDIPNQESDLLEALPESPGENVIELKAEDKEIVDI